MKIEEKKRKGKYTGVREGEEEKEHRHRFEPGSYCIIDICLNHLYIFLEAFWYKNLNLIFPTQGATFRKKVFSDKNKLGCPHTAYKIWRYSDQKFWEEFADRQTRFNICRYQQKTQPYLKGCNQKVSTLKTYVGGFFKNVNM